MSLARRHNPKGRKTRLTAELQEKICSHLRAGLTIETTAAIVGIGVQTFREWVARGLGTDINRSKTPLHAAFAAAIQKARAEGEAYHVLNIRAKAADNWQASAWYLERVYPQKYARRVEVTGSEGGPIETRQEITLKILADPEAVDIVAELYDRLAMGQVDARRPGGVRNQESLDPGSPSDPAQ